MAKVPMTAHGADKLQEELERLKTVERPRIVKAIEEARALGDLRENAEYHSAKDQQGLTEGRIRDIESKLSQAQIIDVTKVTTKDRVVFGATVTVMNLDNDTKTVYQIVGDDEADIKENKISINSPLARALVGKKHEEVVDVTTPGGIVSYQILEIAYI